MKKIKPSSEFTFNPNSWNKDSLTSREIIKELRKYRNNIPILVIDEQENYWWRIEKIVKSENCICFKLYPYATNQMKMEQKIPKKKFLLGDTIKAQDELAFDLVNKYKKQHQRGKRIR
jgi:hypothetical protein